MASGGLGMGTPDQEIMRFIEEAKRVTIVEEGQQNNLFSGEADTMVRIYDGTGKSITITRDTMLRLGIRSTHRRNYDRTAQGGLFQ